MITIYSSKIKQIDQDSYNSFVDSLHLSSLKCPKCKHHHFVKHGYYSRTLKYRNKTVSLRILRVKCLSCGSTHAILLYFIVPYSQYALEVHLKAIQSKFIDHFLEWIGWNENIAEYSYYYIHKQYRKRWKQRLISENISLCPNLFKDCFKHFSMQFMQIKCTKNIFIPLST